MVSSSVDPKLVVVASMAVPVLYIFLEWEFTVWVLAALAGVGWYFFDNNFINKSEVERKGTPQLGQPPQPFLPSEKTWDIDPSTGIPFSKFQPPQYPNQQQFKR